MHFYLFARPIVKNLTKSAAKSNDNTRKMAGNNWKIEFLHKYSRKKLKKMLDIFTKGWYNDIVEKCAFCGPVS